MASSHRPASHPLVVVPLRAGKTRLADVLDDEARSGLRAAMLADVAAALRGAGVPAILVAAGDRESAELALRLGLEVHLDPPEVRGLNEAIAAAVLSGGPSAATDDVLVVTADLPALRADDVAAVLSSDAAVTVAPTLDGGTGALLRRPAAAVGTAYGPGSAAAHERLAREAGLEPTILQLPGFAVDVDTAADLDALAAVPDLGDSTRRWLAVQQVA